MLFVEQNCIHLATPGTEYNKKKICRTSILVAIQMHTQEVKCEPIFQLCEDITEEQ